MTPFDVMLVGLGGGLGSLLCWWLGRVVGERYHGNFPLGTFLINVSGAFAIGYRTRREDRSRDVRTL